MIRRVHWPVLLLILALLGGCTQHYLDKAEKYMSERRYVDARKYYQKALDSKSSLAEQPWFAEAFHRAKYLAAFEQGKQLAARGAHEAAIDKFRTCLELHPQHAPAQTALADAKRQAAASRVRQARSEADAGRLDAAAAHARRAAELDPDNAAAAQAVASAEGRIRPA
ncbi:MAG: hypothetical protein KGY99_09255, partial [Phycisphaerae bacterium]|nr:hypothetical protein [Phycisphaerae bacterium]